MTDTLRLELPLLLPDAHNGPDRCVSRLTATLTGAPGIERLHIIDATSDAPAMLCLHYDPDTVSVSRIVDLAESAGAALTEQYGHALWEVAGVGHQRKARAVAEALRRVDGVLEAEVTSGLVRVEYDRERSTSAELRAVLAKHQVTVAAAPTQHDAHDTDHDHDPDGETGHGHDHGGPFGERSELVFATCSAVLWAVGFVGHLTGAIPDGVLTGLFIASGLFGGYFTLREAIASVRNGRFEIDFLMLVAAAGAWVLGKWEEGALLLALFSLGHALEGYAMGRARRAIEALADLAPETAVVRRHDGERTVSVEVPVDELLVGDVVVVKPNERIPADGFVIAGTSTVNQAPLTGESIPVDKEPVADLERAVADPDAVDARSRLFSGTINGAGQLDLRVTRLASESTLARLATLVREAETQTSPTQRFTDRFERIFVPTVLVLVVAVLVVGAIVGPWADALYRSLAVLVAASPCALAIATPSAVLAAVARAGQLGVLIKGGGPLENLGGLRAVAFDKTGTLTIGRPRLTDVIPAAAVTEHELLDVAIAVETLSDHPLAAAVVRDGQRRFRLAGVEPSLSARDVTAVTGQGVRAVVDGDDVWVGNVALFDDLEGLDPLVLATVTDLQASGRTIMIVRRGDRDLGVLGLMDTPRPEAAATIARLGEVGIRRTVMLSGDHQRVADSIAVQVGLTEAWGDLMPDHKVAAIARLRDEEGRVAMVGDGVNDAPALAHATVGIAMGAAGSDVALETADIALMSDDLAKLPMVIELSRKASRIIRQNLLLSLGMVAFLIPATIVGFVGIGPAVVFHEGSTLVVVANALRLLAHRTRSTTAP